VYSSKKANATTRIEDSQGAAEIDDMHVELPRVALGHAGSPAATTSGSTPSRTSHSSGTAVFVHIIRYRTLCGKILSSLHRSSRRAVRPEPELRKIQQDLALEFEAWRADTKALDLPEMHLSLLIAEARSNFRSNAWYEIL
jgi:hypothetical protein